MSRLFIILSCLVFGKTIAGSYQSYVEDELVGSGRLSSAAIIGNKGGIWAKSRHLAITEEEVKKIIELYKSPSDALAKEVTIGGIRYQINKADDRSIYGKKEASGVVLVRTRESIIIGVYGERYQPEEAANVTEGLAKYLIENGY